MRPLNNKYFGPEPTSLSVQYWNGEEIVSGYIHRQLGERRFLVTDGLHFKRVTLASTTLLAQYCAGTASVPGGDYSIIDGLATITATQNASTFYLTKVMSKLAYTTTGKIDRWKVGAAPNGELLISGVGALVLRDLSTSSLNYPINTNFNVYIRNITPGSTVTATSSDGTILTVNGLYLTGRFATVGTPTITFIETLPGATGSPRTSTYTVNVNATNTLTALDIEPYVASQGRSFFGAVVGKTAGSTITASSDDNTSMTVYGGMVTGVFNTTGIKNLTLVETLSGQTRVSTVAVIVTDETLTDDFIADEDGALLADTDGALIVMEV